MLLNIESYGGFKKNLDLFTFGSETLTTPQKWIKKDMGSEMRFLTILRKKIHIQNDIKLENFHQASTTNCASKMSIDTLP